MFSAFCQAVYDGLWWLATPLAKAHLQKRIGTGKEDVSRLAERFGISTINRPAGKLVWLHGASVGESIALLAVVEKLRAEKNAPAILVTTGTVTSARIMQDRLPQGAIHQFVPLDRRKWIESFLKHWQPDGVIWSESEIWPGAFAGIKRRHIPAVMINARLSAGSVHGWRWFRPWIKDLLSIFTACFAQTEADRQNWESLDGCRAQLFGNLKFVVPELPFDVEQLALINGEIGNRPVWLFSQIHPGEDTIAAHVHLGLKQLIPDILTVVVPRHPNKGGAFADTIRFFGLAVSQRSKGESVAGETDIYMADTLGELGLFYRLCPIAAVANSFVPNGGHNPIEPAKLKAAILYGPHMFNFTAICAAFEAAGAVVPVKGEQELTDKVAWLITHPHEAKVLGDKAYDVAMGEAGSLDKIWAAIGDWRARVLG